MIINIQQFRIFTGNKEEHHGNNKSGPGQKGAHQLRLLTEAGQGADDRHRRHARCRPDDQSGQAGTDGRR